MVVEMEQMASRPFSTCPMFLERPVDLLNTKKEPPDLRGSNRRKKVGIFLLSSFLKLFSLHLPVIFYDSSTCKRRNFSTDIKSPYISFHPTGRLSWFQLAIVLFTQYCSYLQTTPKPAPIALEPINGHKAAVLSLLIQLPCGDEDHTPHGQSGLAIGSSLVSLGKAIYACPSNKRVALCSDKCQLYFFFFKSLYQFHWSGCIWLL